MLYKNSLSEKTACEINEGMKTRYNELTQL